MSMAFRWPAAMPQYHMSHLDRLGRINAGLAKLPALALAGNAYEGVGIPQCIQSGETAAEQVNRALARGRRVIAVGTTVVRALESAAVAAGRVRAGHGYTRLQITAGHKLRAVDGLLTGLHEP